MSSNMTRQEFLKTAAGLAAGLVGSKAFPDFHPALTTLKDFGKTGLKVTALGYGATRTLEPSLAYEALDEGIRFIDTGRQYFNGKNEEMLGRVLKGRRDGIVIQSKISLRLREKGEALLTEDMRKQILSTLEESLEASMKALQTEWIDVLLLHNLRDTELLEHETVRTFFEKSKQSGKIRAWGFSSHMDFIPLLEWVNSTGGCDTVMVPYNPAGGYVHSESKYAYDWDQKRLEKELHSAHEKGIGIVAMKTCSGGAYAQDSGSPATFSSAVRWVTDHYFIHTAAVAVGNRDQLIEHLRAFSKE